MLTTASVRSLLPLEALPGMISLLAGICRLFHSYSHSLALNSSKANLTQKPFLSLALPLPLRIQVPPLYLKALNLKTPYSMGYLEEIMN
jgi:hypothetical protein